MQLKKKLYKLVKKIPKGKISTYKELAHALNTNSYRVIGKLLSKNTSKEIPCHRIVMSSGSVGGYNKGIKQKIKLLKREGIPIKKNRIQNLKGYTHKFSS